MLKTVNLISIDEKKCQYTIENYQQDKSRYCNKSSDRNAKAINIPLSDVNDHKTTYFK